MSGTCQRCSRPFVSDKSWARFCSRSCRRAYGRATEPRKCLKCSLTFQPIRKSHTFCSEACRLSVRDARYRAARRAEERACAGCGTMFRPDRRTTRFCSKRCRHRFDRTSKPARTRLRCVVCGGRHMASECGPREVVRQYGTVVEGRYVPPEGVAVRVMEIPWGWHGDNLSKALKELDA